MPYIKKGERERQLMSFKLPTMAKFKLSMPQLINSILVYQSPTDAPTQILSKLFPPCIVKVYIVWGVNLSLVVIIYGSHGQEQIQGEVTWVRSPPFSKSKVLFFKDFLSFFFPNNSYTALITNFTFQNNLLLQNCHSLSQNPGSTHDGA